MRTKWNLRNRYLQNLSYFYVFSGIAWEPSLKHPQLQVLLFLSQVESAFFKETKDSLCDSNLPEVKRIVRTLVDDRSEVIKKTDKGAYFGVRDRFNFMKLAEKQVEFRTVYEESNYDNKTLSQLTDTRGDDISDKEIKHFIHIYKNS